jgi:hypothetical protein
VPFLGVFEVQGESVMAVIQQCIVQGRSAVFLARLEELLGDPLNVS